MCPARDAFFLKSGRPCKGRFFGNLFGLIKSDFEFTIPDLSSLKSSLLMCVLLDLDSLVEGSLTTFPASSTILK